MKTTTLSFIALAVLACGAEAFAATAATQPATQKVRDKREQIRTAEEDLGAAKASLEKARTDRLETLKSTDAYKAAAAERDAKLQELEKARSGGTPQQKVDASAAYGKARSNVDRLESAISPAEKTLLGAIAAHNARIRELTAALQKQDKAAAAAAAAEKKKEENAPRAIMALPGDLKIGMSLEQVAMTLAGTKDVMAAGGTKAGETSDDYTYDFAIGGETTYGNGSLSDALMKRHPQQITAPDRYHVVFDKKTDRVIKFWKN